METVDISIFSLGLAFLLLIVPVALSLFYKLNVIKPLFSSTIRMSIQLILIGLFLKYLFLWNNTLVNLLWLTVMIIVAVFSAVKGSTIKVGKIFMACFLSFSASTLLIVFYLNSFC